MKYAVDIRVSSKPIFGNFVRTDWWEDPYRVGSMGEDVPEFERRVGKKQFKIWYGELQNNLDLIRYNPMGPVYTEFDESLVMRDSEFDKLTPESHQVGLYLITYRVPGVERLNKPVSMTNLGLTPIDLVGYYRDVRLKAHTAHDYEEYDRILTCPQVHKAVANIKILTLPNSEQTPASVNTSYCNLVSLFAQHGIHHSRIDFRQVFNYFDEIPVDEGIHQEAKALTERADKVDTTEEYLCSDLRYFHAVHRVMECYDYNAFTILYRELCADRLPQKNKRVPYTTHSLNKGDRTPPACEEDLVVWVTTMMMTYLIRQSAFADNPVLVLTGSRALEQLGMPKLLTQSGQVFNHNVLEIHHAVLMHRVREFDQPEQKYGLVHSTTQDWGARYRMDMAEEGGQVVAFGRFNRQDVRMTAAVDHTLGCEFRPIYCSPAVYYEIEGSARELRQVLVKGGYGYHQAIIYGNHVKELRELGEIVDFEVEVFH